MVVEDHVVGLFYLRLGAIHQVSLSGYLQVASIQLVHRGDGAYIRAGHQEVAGEKSHQEVDLTGGAAQVDVLLEPFVHVAEVRLDEHHGAVNLSLDALQEDDQEGEDAQEEDDPEEVGVLAVVPVPSLTSGVKFSNSSFIPQLVCWFLTSCCFFFFSGGQRTV